MKYHVQFVFSIKSASTAGIRRHLWQSSHSTQAFLGGKSCSSRPPRTISKSDLLVTAVSSPVLASPMPSTFWLPTASSHVKLEADYEFPKLKTSSQKGKVKEVSNREHRHKHSDKRITEIDMKNMDRSRERVYIFYW